MGISVGIKAVDYHRHAITKDRQRVRNHSNKNVYSQTTSNRYLKKLYIIILTGH